MPSHQYNSPEIKDERWAIKIFRPLLQLLHGREIPNPPGMTEIHLADYRNFIIKGMERCVIVVEQEDLPRNVGGMLITSYDERGEYFKLHILIAKRLFKNTSYRRRSLEKLTFVHEFTHAVAALAAIARVSSAELKKRLKEIFREKTDVLFLKDIMKLANELNTPVMTWLINRLRGIPEESCFPDEHYRLGFEDFPVSYPIILEEFLFSKEMFDENFTRDTIENICGFYAQGSMARFWAIVNPILDQICNQKALYRNFVRRRFFQIFIPIYGNYLRRR